jgi:hypothetical protein
VYLDATCTIGTIDFAVSADLPGLQSNSDADWTFVLQAVNSSDELAASSFLAGLDSGLSLTTAMTNLDANIKASLVDEAATVLTASCIVHRSYTTTPTPTTSYSIREVGFDFRALLDWTPVSTVNLTSVSVAAKASRLTDSDPWSYQFFIFGTMTLTSSSSGIPTLLRVSGTLDMSQTGSLTLSIQAPGQGQVGGRDLMDKIVPDSSSSASAIITSAAPPTMPTLSSFMSGQGGGRVPISAQLSLTNTSGAWSVSSISVWINLIGFTWQSPGPAGVNALRLNVSNIYLSLKATKSTTVTTSVATVASMHVVQLGPATVALVPQEATPPPGHVLTTTVSTTLDDWVPEGQIGGTISLFGGQFVLSASIVYSSATTPSTLAIQASIPDGKYYPFSVMAYDAIFAPNGSSPVDLGVIANSSPAPSMSTCPIGLSKVTDPTNGTGRVLSLTFSDTALVRAWFRGQYSGQWPLTSSITLQQLGIMFDLNYPQSSDATQRSIKGYIYGQFALGNTGNTTLFAFVAGESRYAGGVTTTEIWAGLSVTAIPGSRVGVSPTDVIQSPAMTGWTLPTSGWGIPALPIQVTDLSTSFDAQAQVKFVTDPSSTTNTMLVDLVKASLSTASTWSPFTGVSLTEVQVALVVERSPIAPLSYNGLIEAIGTCQANANTTNYSLVFRARFQRSPNAPSTFLLQVTAATVQTSTGSLSPSAFMQMPLFGNHMFTSAQLTPLLPGTVMSPLIRRYVYADRADGNIISADSFLAATGSSVACTATVSNTLQQPTVYNLSQLTLTYSQAAASVSTVNSTISFQQATLSLAVINPLSTNPQYTASITGIIRIGNLQFLGSITRMPDASIVIEFSVSAGSTVAASSVLTNLGLTLTTIPSQAPFNINSTSSAFTITLTLQKNSSNNLILTKMDLSLSATGSWSLGSNGQIVIGSLTLRATWEATVDVGLTSSTQPVLTINGNAVFSSPNITTALNVTGTLTQQRITITLTLGSAQISSTNLVGNFVTGGLSSFTGPTFPSQSGVSSYSNAFIATGTVVFILQGNVWTADSVSVGVATEQDWTWALVDPTLEFNSINLDLVVMNLSSTPSLSANLRANLTFIKTDSTNGNVTLSMKADSTQLSGELNLTECNLTTLVYAFTAGRWDIPDLAWPSFPRIVFLIDWNQGTASISAIGPTWSLTDTEVAERLAAMEDPRLTVNVSKATSVLSLRGLEAVGLLEGDAYVLNVHIPISYELPDGPLRIWGYDVEQIYEMCKKLAELIEDVATICEIMMDVVGVAEALAVGTTVS